MGHKIFLSYSSKDQDAANAICAALEGAGLSCWIAPRDITAGSQWGGSIVSAVESAQAVLVVFSENANNSPQVAREMEIAVARRLPIVPVRLSDVMPTEDMQYFLGVSHWFNAYPKPLATYLPQIVASVGRVLQNVDNPWRRIRGRLPQGRNSQLLIGGGVLALVALLAFRALVPSTPDYMAAARSPIEGRWQAEIADAQGKKQNCVWDVQQMGQAAFSDSCPLPFTGARGAVQVSKDGVWAPQFYKAGTDEGSFTFLGGTMHGFAGSFHKTVLGRLVTNDAEHGEITWAKASASTPMQDASKKVVPEKTDWPLADVPGLAKRATGYVRSHWHPDAVLMDFKAELMETNFNASAQTPAGGVEMRFEYYSPSTQEGLMYMPNSQAGELFPEGAIDRNPNAAVPETFMDLPQAVDIVRGRGVRGKQIKQAELENWGRQTYYGDVTVSGLAWVIDSALNERKAVEATVK